MYLLQVLKLKGVNAPMSGVVEYPSSTPTQAAITQVNVIKEHEHVFSIRLCLECCSFNSINSHE